MEAINSYPFRLFLKQYCTHCKEFNDCYGVNAKKDNIDYTDNYNRQIMIMCKLSKLYRI